MIKISAVVITFNEEKNIERCINSLNGIVDEIVVLDSFSTDETEKICKKYGVRFFQHTFDGHIEQKNRAITFAQYPYILSLDADEALSEELKKSILAIKTNWQNNGYYMSRLTNYCGKWIKHCGWYPDKKLRLWDSTKGKWGGINPHDKFELFAGDINTGELKGDILHYSYYSIDDHIKQADYFTTISANALFKQGKKVSIFNLVFSPLVKFMKDYFFNLGILDGYYGFIICKISAQATYSKYKKLQKLYELKR